MRLAYLAHPIAGDVGANLAAARRHYARLYRERPDLVVVAPYLLDLGMGLEDDANPAQRERGLLRMEALCRVVGQSGGEIHLCGPRISEGMRRELEAARGAGALAIRVEGEA
jgi:hypothetical protein